MAPSDAIYLTVVVLVAVLAMAWYGRRRRTRGEAFAHNLGLYDHPYTHYPTYEGREAVAWAGDLRCAASCAQSPCTVWCR